jgi:hypothetical protein
VTGPAGLRAERNAGLRAERNAGLRAERNGRRSRRASSGALPDVARR